MEQDLSRFAALLHSFLGSTRLPNLCHLNVTSNDPDPFNFDSAARSDAENSARFTQQGNCVVVYFGRMQGENVVRTPMRAEVSPWPTQSI